MEHSTHPETLTTTVINRDRGQTDFTGLYLEVVLHTEVNQKPGERTIDLEFFGTTYSSVNILLTPEDQEALIKGLQRHQSIILNPEEKETLDVQPEETN